MTYDRPGRVDRLLEHLPFQQSTPDEVIVVNNGANEETRTVVESYATRFDRRSISLRHLARSDDTTLQRGRNTAIAVSNGDVICFVDDDVVPRKSWLKGIERGYEWDDSAVAVGGPAPITDDELSLQYDIDNSSTNQNHFNRFGEHRQIAYKWIPPAPVKTDTLVGANMSFKVDVLEEIGGFDPSYEGHPQFEETDVMAKLWNRGETIVYHPHALVYHINDSRKQSERVSYWYGRNSVRFRRKNFPETYHRSLFRLLFGPEFGTPVWRQLKNAVMKDDSPYRWRLRGYLDELILDRIDESVSDRLKAPYAKKSK
ncbi:glycosyltransferase family 2 protein [Halosolutus halophilus]|uniref:glycosyltransferase family 2 protein n=1 Tax=Halosolutus halophilus TaxID=1552990 RepID=UPI0022350217|nr:glycosyltransferase [Halosolutus halophilus]